jgi:putative membrane protein insertion efficiency factor
MAAAAALGVILWNAAPLALGGVHLYQRTLSPLGARAGIRCRFVPTCSRYAEAVIARDGIVRGGWRALVRVSRCGPWTQMGTVDPP